MRLFRNLFLFVATVAWATFLIVYFEPAVVKAMVTIDQSMKTNSVRIGNI